MTYQLIHGSAHHLPEIADQSVHSLICSPPYYGLRQYSGEQNILWPTVEYAPMAGLAPIRVQGCDPGCEHEWGDNLPAHKPNQVPQTNTGGKHSGAAANGQTSARGAYCIHCGGWRGGLGLEVSIEAFIGHLILCLREWHRVLRDDGVAWVNLGDSYNGSGGAGGDYGAGGLKEGQPKYPGRRINGLKPKDLCMIPARLALAAQADGWFLRSAIVWAKGVSFIPHYAGSCMPESVQDRPTQSYEMVYMLAKQEKYFYDAEAIKEESIYPDDDRKARSNGHQKRTPTELMAGIREGSATYSKRNLRNVWALNPKGYSGAHFAVFPPELPETCIRASTSAHGVCAKCSAPWRRVVERTPAKAQGERGTDGHSQARAVNGNADRNLFNGTKWYENAGTSQTTGWQPTCQCNCDEVIPATIIDPFVGSGTSIRAAMKLGRNAIGVDISDEYLGDLVPERASNIQMELAL